MNVLSLFDGISCGQVALQRAGITVNKYYASEIDNASISVTQKNFPDTIQLGDVRNVKCDSLDRIDILLAGSPCQGFSRAGKRLHLDDDRSKLYFEFLRLLRELAPTYFILENVVMPKEIIDIINEHLGVRPIKINSSLVSAQNRTRLYWTNIPGVEQPQDKNLYLGHIVENIPTNRPIQPMIRDIPTEQIRDQIKQSLGNSKYLDTFLWRWDTHGRLLVMYPDGRKIQRIGRIACMDNKTELITCMTRPHIMTRDRKVRQSFPEECESLQTLPQGYTEGLSVSNRYKVLGNCWTVDVIAHILRYSM